MLLSLLGLGFLLGMKHALEADHVAAVASLSTRSASLKNTVKVATAWGIGHAAALVLLGSTLIALETTLPDRITRLLEFGVGVMLVILGFDVLRRLRNRRIHAHVHQHDGGARHLHFHSHADAKSHAHHVHEHSKRLLPRALLLGSVHGMAGTAALVVIALPTLHSSAGALAYLFLFALGSILGMVLFSIAISVPLHLSAQRLNRFSGALEAGLGLVNIGLGCWIALEAQIV